VSNQVFWRGWDGYEPETAPLFFEMARRARLVVDVGAYVGYYSLLAALANPEGLVLAFEPSPSNFARLRSNVDRNRLANVRCEPTALGERDASGVLFHAAVELPCGSSLSPRFASQPDHVGSEVRVLTLDGYLGAADLRGVDLVKIDTEGTEPEVLRGMMRTLSRDRPRIFCEVLDGHGTGPAIEKILGPLGYRYYLLTDTGARERPIIAADPQFLNHLFVPDPRAESPRPGGQ
jgi:FkbM family methyltransferase